MTVRPALGCTHDAEAVIRLEDGRERPVWPDDADDGEARPYRNVELRGGTLRGHLRQGQHRRPRAGTSARDEERTRTLLDHELSVAHTGHYRVSGRTPWDGPPTTASPSPKSVGELVEQIGGRLPSDRQGVATTTV